MADGAKALRAAFQELDAKRQALELEIEVLASRTMEGEALVDTEGFPRGDIDVWTVRTERAKLAELHTDHKRVTADIERVMAQIFDAER